MYHHPYAPACAVLYFTIHDIVRRTTSLIFKHVPHGANLARLFVAVTRRRPKCKICALPSSSRRARVSHRREPDPTLYLFTGDCHSVRCTFSHIMRTRTAPSLSDSQRDHRDTVEMSHTYMLWSRASYLYIETCTASHSDTTAGQSPSGTEIQGFPAPCGSPSGR